MTDLHLWELGLVVSATVLACASLNALSRVAWSARFIAVCLLLAAGLLLVLA